MSTNNDKLGEVYARSRDHAVKTMLGGACLQQAEMTAQLDVAAAQIGELGKALEEANARTEANQQLIDSLAKRYPDDPDLRHLVGHVSE